MRVSLVGLVRLAVVSGLGLCVVAVGLGRLVPPPSRAWRSLERAHHVALNRRLYGNGSGSVPLLNLESGLLENMPVPDGGRLDHATPSPWRDEEGRTQVVGRWSRGTGAGTGRVAEDFGLARLTYPDGELLQTYSLDVLPNGAVAWFPGISTRVLFTAGNGSLYQFDFDAARKELDSAARPREVRWAGTVKPADHVFLFDPSWPNDSAWGGCLVASLSYAEGENRSARRTATKVWWLRLNRDGTRIEAAGRLTPPDAVDDAAVEERYPVPGRTSAGEPVLAYLSRRAGRPGWELRVAPMSLSSKTGEPVMGPGEGHLLADDCAPWPPAFGLEGDWVACIPRVFTGSPRVLHRPLSPRQADHAGSAQNTRGTKASPTKAKSRDA